jgi:signal transduction histidine kinase
VQRQFSRDEQKMGKAEVPEKERRVLVVAPVGRDAGLVCRLLERAQIACGTTTPEGLAEEISKGAGTAIIAEESLNVASVERLANLLHEQPSWSDLPLILLTASGRVTPATVQRNTLREPLGNVLLLERPVRPETMLSSVQNALRSRFRQYQVRDYVRQQAQAEEALRRTEKLAVAGRLAASIAHEINNPLEAVTNIVWLLQNNTELPREAREYLRTIQQELDRVTHITKQTLGFYRESSRSSQVDVGELINTVLGVFSARIRNKDVRVCRDTDVTCKVLGRAGEIRQILANLFSNSLDAVPQHGQIRIRCAPAYRRGRPGIKILLGDNGPGIPHANRSKIFEAFFSTKDAVGTGLGLWVVKDLVTKHGGSIQFRSSNGDSARPRWTVFSVFLPSDYEAHLLLNAG